MVVARRDFDPKTFDPKGNLIELVNDLTFMAMVGIVDPPRAEAKAAIEKCHSAGIQVRMITGDHAVTAAAIGHQLGIEGEALTGAQFKAIPDEQLKQRLDGIGVVARVAPEDKIRLVTLLQEKQNIVAMTGDGVNDAPALKKADIGVAMGITGTEVSKGAAVMILTDDNFATIVKAVEYGRGLYDNLVHFIRFQMTALVAFIAAFLGAALFFILGGIPFEPLPILWINFAIQVPIAIALGFDKPASDLMQRKPRPLGATGALAWAVDAPDRHRSADGRFHAVSGRPLRRAEHPAGGDDGIRRLFAGEHRRGVELSQRDAERLQSGYLAGSAPGDALRVGAAADLHPHRAGFHAECVQVPIAHRQPVVDLPRPGPRPGAGG